MLSQFRLCFLVLTLISASPPSGQAAERQDPCQVSLKGNNRAKNQSLREIQFYAARNILITGGDFYPLDVILKNLGLDHELETLSDSSVVSVGEGYSALLPHLLSKEIDAVAVDPAYPATDFRSYLSQLPPAQSFAGAQYPSLWSYIESFGPFLLHGTSFDIPLEDDSKDVLLSHKLVNNTDNFSTQDGIRFVEEALRVVRREIRINGFEPEQIETITRYLKRKYPGTHHISSEEIGVVGSLNGQNERKHTSHLFITRILK